MIGRATENAIRDLVPNVETDAGVFARLWIKQTAQAKASGPVHEEHVWERQEIATTDREGNPFTLTFDQCTGCPAKAYRRGDVPMVGEKKKARRRGRAP